MLKTLKKRSILIGTATTVFSTGVLYKSYIQNPITTDARNPAKVDEKIDYVIHKLDPIDQFHAPKNPVVLCHGLSGFSKLILLPSVYQITKFFRNIIEITKDDQSLMHEIYNSDEDPNYKGFLEIDYWIGVQKVLEAQNVTVFTAHVPPFSSIEERATVLNNFIKRKIEYLKRNNKNTNTHNNKDLVKINLIAHSMGGLDARYLISAISPEEKQNYEVISLTTISTPHHGSVVANYVCDLFDDLKYRMGVTSPNVRLPPAFYELTTDYVDIIFNNEMKDDPNVKYFSYGAYFKPSWNQVFYLSWKIIHNLTNELNDGMVSVNSSKHGEFRGVLPNLDHLNIINWQVNFQSKRDPNELDILKFYLKIVDDLGKCGC